MKTREYEMVHFISFCIENYKHLKGKSGEEAVELFSKLGVIDYLLENYEVSLSRCPLARQGDSRNH